MRSRRWRKCCTASCTSRDTQIGTLNAIYSLPNIFLVMVGGVLVDRFSARVMVLVTTVICLLGAMLTALGTHFPVMAAGRLLFGIGAETLVVAVLVALYQWFSPGRHFALQMSLNLSLARMGSYLADRSTSFAKGLYDQGWQPPLWLAVGFAAALPGRGPGVFLHRPAARRRAGRSRPRPRRSASSGRTCGAFRPPTGCWSPPAWPSSPSFFPSAARLPSSICRRRRG